MFVCRWVECARYFYLLTSPNRTVSPKCPPKKKKIEKHQLKEKKHHKPTKYPPKNLCKSAKRQGGECARKNQGKNNRKNIWLGAVILNPGSTPRNGASASAGRNGWRWNRGGRRRRRMRSAMRPLHFFWLLVYHLRGSLCAHSFCGHFPLIFGAASQKVISPSSQDQRYKTAVSFFMFNRFWAQPRGVTLSCR